MKKTTFTRLCIVGIILLAYPDTHADNRERTRSPHVAISVYPQTFAQAGRYPYGGSKRSRYGEKRTVMTEKEAQKILREYFPGDVKIGRIKKRKFYFESEIRDRHDRIIDRVIIDRRSGRIRSVY